MREDIQRLKLDTARPRSPHKQPRISTWTSSRTTQPAETAIEMYRDQQQHQCEYKGPKRVDAARDPPPRLVAIRQRDESHLGRAEARMLQERPTDVAHPETMKRLKWIALFMTPSGVGRCTTSNVETQTSSAIASARLWQRRISKCETPTQGGAPRPPDRIKALEELKKQREDSR